jgi:subtilase family serine protease
VTVQYAVTGGTAIGNGVDYTLPPGTISFAPGETSKSITMSVVDDSQPEPNETVVVSMSNPVNATIGQIPSFTYTIVDNDPPPDLAISGGISVAGPTSVPAGQPRGLVLSSWTVVNQGKGAAGAFSNGFYLSTDSAISSSDTYLDGNSNSGLGAGQSYPWGGPSLTIPANTVPGRYWVGVLVDRTDAVYESNEANNYASATITVLPGADLAITTTTLTASPPRIPLAGGTVSLSSWTVQNQGYVSTGSFQISYYLSTDQNYDSKDILLGTGSNLGLAPGASATYAPSFPIPAGTPKTSYYIVVVVDLQNSVQEFNESNNSLTSSNTISVY